MLTLTDNAIKRFKDILAESNSPDHGIRIFDAGGGCCGPSLAIDTVKEAQKGDVTLEKDGVKVFLENKINKLLSEATMDFSEKQGIILRGAPRSSCCG